MPLALDDGDETGVVEGLLGGVGGLHVGIRADLHAVEIVVRGRDDERRKVLLLQQVGHSHGVAFVRDGRDLEDDRTLIQLRGLETRRVRCGFRSGEFGTIAGAAGFTGRAATETDGDAAGLGIELTVSSAFFLE
jgi:hypothetical protein